MNEQFQHQAPKLSEVLLKQLQQNKEQYSSFSMIF